MDSEKKAKSVNCQLKRFTNQHNFWAKEYVSNYSMLLIQKNFMNFKKINKFSEKLPMSFCSTIKNIVF